MKTNIICSTIILLAVIAAVVVGCFVAETAWPLIALPFLNLSLPACPPIRPIQCFFQHIAEPQTSEQFKVPEEKKPQPEAHDEPETEKQEE